MNKTFIFIIILLSYFQINAQNLDSLYNAFVRLKAYRIETIQSKAENIVSKNKTPNTPKVIKCGFGLSNSIVLNFKRFTYSQQKVLSVLLQRPQLQTSMVTPSGKFRVHYDTTGANKPNYIKGDLKASLNALAKALDSAYNYEVNILKYPPPPSDMEAGGDDRYDIYVENLPSGFYGTTTPETDIGNSKYTAYTEIDNDFAPSENYNTFGIKAAEVTVAHEFHHAIQIGDYIDRYSQDGFYYEISSTAMEEFVFNSVNDYYFYMGSYFNNPGRSLSKNKGYNLAILNIYLKDRFGFGILKRIWELMVHNRAIKAIALAIAENGSTFAHEFNTFGVWTYFTGYRSIPGNNFFDFNDAVHYPLISPITTVEFSPPKKTLSLELEPAANMFIVFPEHSGNVFDTLVSIITNSDVQNAIDSQNSFISFNYTLSSVNGNGYTVINDKYYSKIESTNKDFLRESDIFNNIPVNNNVHKIAIDYAYPQPFRYSKNSYVFIPAAYSTDEYAKLNIYTPDMHLVYSGKKRIYSINKVVVQWNCRDNEGNKLPSGVYIYVDESGGVIKKGKLVIFND